MDMFIRLSYVSGNETLFKGIQSLPGGATIQISDGKWTVLEQFRYGDLIVKDIYHNMPEEELIRIGKEKWLGVIDGLYNAKSEIVVPISGGLDSRAVLAGLLECTDASNINTYTFGLPKTLDFEIGNRIAALAGTRHTNFDLSKYIFNDQVLKETCQQTDGNVNIFALSYLVPIFSSYSETASFWSGFMLDVLAGHFVTKSSLRPQIKPDLTTELREYFLRATKKVSNYSVSLNQIDEWIRLIDIDTLCSKEISVAEQMNYYLGVERKGGNHLFFNRYDYVTPFAENQWIEFMLSVPISHRLGKRLYKRLFQRSFPSLFSLPIKDNLGLSLEASKLEVMFHNFKYRLQRYLKRHYLNPKTNYIDFNRELRSPTSLKKHVETTFFDLQKRQIIDNKLVDRLWKEHQAGKQNNCSLLMNLASLENIIKTFNLKC